MGTLVLEKTETKKKKVVHNTILEKKEKSLWDYVMKFKKKPLFTIAKEDRDLILGSNMMTRLMQEEKL